MSSAQLVSLALILAATTVAGGAGATGSVALDQCLIYGFAPHSRDYAQCRMNLRHYWTTGPCGNSSFAWTHREYCHLNPPPFI